MEGSTPKYKIDEKEIERLENNFTYHAPKDDQQERYVRLRDEAKKLAYSLCECVPPGRERSVALTQLEDAIMWSNAGIARGE